jgi:DNA-directed RNA polymerase subunit RPC12/RpoP
LADDMKFCPSCGTRAAGPAPIPVAKPKATELPTSCSRCGAPLGVSREDVIITCRYCGNTILVATHEEIKTHSMLDNQMQPQQAVEAAKEYMDSGVFRAGVSKEARITGVKLRYVPFWVFPVDAETYYRGRKGLGVSELREMKHAVTDKKESRWGKLGRFAKAATELAIEAAMAKQRSRPQFRTISNSFSRHYSWTTLARRTMLSDVRYYEVPLERKIPFDAGRIPSDAEFFNTELKMEEARSRVRAEVETKQRELAGEEVDTVDQCNSTMTFAEGELIHAPVWFVHYELDERDYAIAVDGSTGKILGGGRPLFKIT